MGFSDFPPSWNTGLVTRDDDNKGGGQGVATPASDDNVTDGKSGVFFERDYCLATQPKALDLTYYNMGDDIPRTSPRQRDMVVRVRSERLLGDLEGRNL